MPRAKKFAIRRRPPKDADASLLIRTKLEPPAAPQVCVPRDSLLDGFRKDPRWRVVLLQAPAGYGKSEFLRQFFADASLPVERRAWLELDREDDDPRRLLRYLAAALARADLLPDRQPAWQELLNGEVERARHFDQLTALLADQAEPLLLVFDACERMRESSSWEMLGQMMHYLSPAVRVVFASRTDVPIPFARERGSPEFVELGFSQLRATSQEADTLLGALEMETEEIEALRRKCQGWWHGLRLGSRAVQELHAEDREQELQRFTGTHPMLAEYFQRDACPDDAATLRLLELAAVPERINQGLFNHLLGSGAHPLTLAKLLASSPFFMRAEEHGWYLPHPLYADFLRAGFAQRDDAALRGKHIEAAVWLSGEGHVEAAVRHALHVQDDALALGFINRCFDDLVDRGDLETLAHWRTLLPENYVNRYPLVALLWAWELLARGKRSEALALGANVRLALQREATRASAAGRSQELARVDTLYATTVIRHGTMDFEVPETISERSGLQALAMAQQCAWQGDRAGVETALALVSARQARIGSGFLAVLGDSLRAWHYLYSGDLESALGLARLNERRVESDQERRLLGRLPWLVQVRVLWERNEAPDLAEDLHQTLTASHYLRPAWQAVEGWCLLADMWSRQGRTAEAGAALRKVRARLESPPLQRILYAAEIELALHSGEMRVADELATAAGIAFCGDEEQWSPAWLASLTAAARIALARGKPKMALELLHRLQAATPDWQAWTRARLLALECVALSEDGQQELALEALARLVGEGARVHMVRTFLDAGPVMEQLLRALYTGQRIVSAPLGMYVNRLLEAFASVSAVARPSQPRPEVPEPVEKLTDREREVLRMVADGHSNQEVSERLFLSIGTIKWHLHNIYDKLMVRNRTQAVKRARELNWMP